LSQVGHVTAVDEGGLRVGLVRQGVPAGQALEVVTDEGLAGLDLDGPSPRPDQGGGRFRGRLNRAGSRDRASHPGGSSSSGRFWGL